MALACRRAVADMLDDWRGRADAAPGDPLAAICRGLPLGPAPRRPGRRLPDGRPRPGGGAARPRRCAGRSPSASATCSTPSPRRRRGRGRTPPRGARRRSGSSPASSAPAATAQARGQRNRRGSRRRTSRFDHDRLFADLVDGVTSPGEPPGRPAFPRTRCSRQRSAGEVQRQQTPANCGMLPTVQARSRRDTAGTTFALPDFGPMTPNS